MTKVATVLISFGVGMLTGAVVMIRSIVREDTERRHEVEQAIGEVYR